MKSLTVKELRSQNRFEEAYQLSLQELKQRPDDIWMKRSHAWSIYFLLKKFLKAGQEAQFRHYFSEFVQLNIPAEDGLIHERMGYFKGVLESNFLTSRRLIQEGKYGEAFDLHFKERPLPEEQLGWAIFYMLRAVNKKTGVQWSPILERLRLYQSNANPQPQLVYKLVMQELIKVPVDHWREDRLTVYLEFFGLFNCLESEDYEKQEFNGKRIISLAERLFISYSKALLREKANPDKIQRFIKGIVEGKLEGYKGMLYVPYFKAKLLLETGGAKESLEAFLPFARKKKDEFWVWQIFAEYFQEDHETYFSCLCKAMTCRANEKFLLGIRERLLIHLIREGEYKWAKSEIDQIIRIRECNGWGMRAEHRNYINTQWYKDSPAMGLEGVYEKHIGGAERIIKVNSGVFHQPILVVGLNCKKKFFNYMTSSQKFGFGKYEEIPLLGSIYLLSGKGSGEGYTKVLSMEKVEGELEEFRHYRKQVKGEVKKGSGRSFGFVQDVFIPPDIMEEFKLENGCLLSGIAIQDLVKNEWKWKLIKIVRSEAEKEFK